MDYDCDSDFKAMCSVVHIRRARKQHTCCECQDAILHGSKYEYITGIWDKVPMSFKTCMPCALIRKDYYPCGAIFGELAETLEKCLGFDYRVVEEEDGS